MVVFDQPKWWGIKLRIRSRRGNPTWLPFMQRVVAPVQRGAGQARGPAPTGIRRSVVQSQRVVAPVQRGAGQARGCMDLLYYP